jgi:hypothetical protein
MLAMDVRFKSRRYGLMIGKFWAVIKRDGLQLVPIQSQAFDCSFCQCSSCLLGSFSITVHSVFRSTIIERAPRRLLHIIVPPSQSPGRWLGDIRSA